jgi:hypothetical protein
MARGRNGFTSGAMVTHSPEVKQKISETLKARVVPLRERFMARVDQRGPGDCWNWRGGIGLNGYGSMSLSETAKAYAHRVSYELFKGPIPETLTIDHLCRNRRCVNPAHLEAVTNAENARRAVVKTHTCPKGHPKDGLVAGKRPRAYCKTCNRDRANAYHARRKAAGG